MKRHMGVSLVAFLALSLFVVAAMCWWLMAEKREPVFRTPIESEVNSAIRLLEAMSGTFEVEIVQGFPQIATIDLSNTRITNSDIALIGTQTGVRKLSLAHTAISDEGMRYLQTLPCLEYLDLTGTNISNQGLAYISGFSKLTRLHLGRTRISSKGLHYLDKVHSLEYLSLEELDLSAEKGLIGLESLIRLKHIDLVGTGVTDESVASLGGLTDLEYVDLSYCPVSDRGINHVCKLRNLNTLILRRTGIVELPDIGKLTNIVALDLSENFLGQCALSRIKAIPGIHRLRIERITNNKAIDCGRLATSLSHLDLSRNRFDNLHLLGLSTQLKCIAFNGCAELFDCDLKEVLSSRVIKTVEELDLEGCPITNESLRKIGLCENLLILNLGNSSITDQGLRFLSGLIGLQKLSVVHSAISDKGVESIGKMDGIKHLNLAYTNITDAGLEYISNDAPLEVLYLGGNKLTDKCLESISRFSMLKTLSLSNSLITDSGLCSLSTNKRLQTLILNDTTITDDGLKLVSAIPSLQEISVTNSRVTFKGISKLRCLPKLRVVFAQNNHITRKEADLFSQENPSVKLLWE